MTVAEEIVKTVQDAEQKLQASKKSEYDTREENRLERERVAAWHALRWGTVFVAMILAGIAVIVLLIAGIASYWPSTCEHDADIARNRCMPEIGDATPDLVDACTRQYETVLEQCAAHAKGEP